MEHAVSLTSLMVVVGAAFLIPILLHKLRLRAVPVVVAEIVVGLMIGKTGFNWVSQDPWLQLLSLLGFIYLMFLSGVEIDFSSFRKSVSGKKGGFPFRIAALLFGCILVLSFGMAWLMESFGQIKDPYLMTLIIATISLGVVVPVLKEKKVMETELGQIILLVSVISDFVTMILLAVYISIRAGNARDILLLLLFFVLAFAIYRFIRRLPGGGLLRLLSKGTTQLGTRAVFALILLFVVLSESLGAENILGAFLAGMIVSLLTPDKDFVRQLDTFGYGFLIPIFFVMVGVKLDLRQLFSDSSVYVLIPLLVAVIFLSKMLPALWLKKWYAWTEVLGSGVLMSSTLSLVIAASTIALELGLIHEALNGALILTAILTCLIFPVLFSKIFPKGKEKRPVVAMIGANYITLRVSQDLSREGYDVSLFSERTEETDQIWESPEQLPAVCATSLDPEALAEKGVFSADIVVFGSPDDEANTRLALEASRRGTGRIIARVEDPEKQEIVQKAGVTAFSTLNASRTLLKALIEYPSAIRLFSRHDDSILEIAMNHPAYEGTPLRRLPLLGDVLILRIYRGDSFLIPHGDTELKLGDRLLASGDAEQLQAMKRELE
jgi:Kef-type K+ transport system membrane component KefB/Trk K+ transport system NAD-binding subunit